MIPMLLGLAAPLVKSIAEKFMDEGLNLAASAITGGGKKAKEFIEEKTGLNLNEPEKLTREEMLKVRELEQTPEHQIKLKELSLEILKEEHRHEEMVRDDILEDAAGARGMYTSTDHALQDEVAKRILHQTNRLIPGLFILNIAVIIAEAFSMFPKGVSSGITSILGVAIGHTYNERKTIVEFCFGGALKPKE